MGANERIELFNQDDDEILRSTFGALPGSVTFDTGIAAINVKCSRRVAKAAEDMAKANSDLVETTKEVVEAHHKIIDWTKNLVYATWGLVVVTVILVIMDFAKK